MEALAVARQLLPVWAAAVLWLVGPVLGLVGFTVTRWGMFRMLRELPTEPWTERARLAYTARMLGRIARVYAWLAGTFLAVYTWNGECWPVLRAPFTLSAAFAGPLLASLLFEARLRKLRMRVVLRSWAAASVALFAFLYGLALLRVATVLLTGRDAWTAAVVGFGVCSWLGLGGGLTLARLLGLARPASARIESAVQLASARVGVRCRAVFELDWAQCNAWALPLSRRIVFAQGALALEDDELEALAAHELGHLAEPVRIKWVRPVAVVLLAAAAFAVPPLPGVSWRSMAAYLVALLTVVLVVRRASRKGEQYADSRAKDDAGVYARALARTYELNLIPLILPRPGAHGHLYDRLVAAGRPPAEPRPPPARMPSFGLRVLLALPMVLLILALVEFRDVDPATAVVAAWQLAIGSQSHLAFAELGYDCLQRQDFRSAVVCYRAAKVDRPRSVLYAADLAGALAYDRQCDAARASLGEAVELSNGVDPAKLPLKTIQWASSAVSWCGRHGARTHDP